MNKIAIIMYKNICIRFIYSPNPYSIYVKFLLVVYSFEGFISIQTIHQFDLLSL